MTSRHRSLGGERRRKKRLTMFLERTRSKHNQGPKERLFVRTRTHNLQAFGVIPFVKLQNVACFVILVSDFYS